MILLRLAIYLFTIVRTSDTLAAVCRLFLECTSPSKSSIIRWGWFDLNIYIRRMSSENAVVMPMSSFAFSKSFGSWSKVARVPPNSESRWQSASERLRLGAMAIDSPIVLVLQRILSVANRVQRSSFVGNGTLEISSRTELWPEDWSPQTISSSKAT